MHFSFSQNLHPMEEKKVPEEVPSDEPYELSDLRLKWDKKNRYAEIKKGDKSVRVRIPECNIMFNFIPYPFSNYVYIHMRTYDPSTIQYFSLIDEQLKKAIPNYSSTFFRGRGKSKTLVCQIPIDKERRLLMNIYDENHELVNKATEPALTVHDLMWRYHVNPGRAKLTLWIKNIHVVGNTQFVNIQVTSMALCHYEENDICTVNIGDL